MLKTSKLTTFRLEGWISTEALCAIVQGAKECKTLHSIRLGSIERPSNTSSNREQLGIHVVELLARHPKLKDFGLSSTQMSVDEFSTVMTAIKDGGHISRLVVMNGDVTKEHLKAISLLLTKNTVLTTLNLSRWWPDDEGLQVLADGLSDNRHLLQLQLHRRADEVESPALDRIQTQLQENRCMEWACKHGGIFNNAPSQKWLPTEMGTQVLQALYIAEQRLRGPRMTSKDLDPMLLEIRLAAIALRDQMTSGTSATSTSFDS